MVPAPRPHELRKFLAPEFLFGQGALRLAGQHASHLGARRVLLVSDPGVAAAGWTSAVEDSLAAAGLRYVVYTAVSPNPRAAEILEGAEVYLRESCDSIVAVGGGSPIDCAKGIGIVVSSNRPIETFEGVDRVTAPMPPTICIPTTAGTGADVSQFAIVSSPAEHRKMAIISKAVVPDLALVDPTPLTTMDGYLTACTGMDALVHAIEAFVSSGAGPVTDMYALEAIRLVARHLPSCIERPGDLDEREAMMLASLHAGLAFSNASLGLVHAMAHALGGLLDLPHGECNAILLEHVVAFNFDAAPDRYAEVAGALGADAQGSPADVKRRLVGCLSDLRRRVGIETTLSRAGVRPSDVPTLAANALADACIVTNPRTAEQRDVERLYEQAA